MAEDRRQGGAAPGARLVLLNNSRETFTPTVSGAIATCLWEVSRCAAQEGFPVHVISVPHDAAHYPVPSISFVRGPRSRVRARERAARARRRVTGWAHVDQARFATDAIAHLRRAAPTAVICSNDPEVAVAIRRALPGVTVVHWFHNLMVPSDRFRRAYAHDKGIVSVAVSAYVARSIEQVFQMTPRSVRVAVNGVDLRRFAPSEAHPEGAVPTVGFVGRIAVEKGADVLLRAALILARGEEPFRLQIVGDTNWGYSNPGPYRDEVRALVDDVRRAGVEVDMLGHVVRADLPDAVRSSDIHVVPSRWDEPCALTILEGLAAGRAVVTSATGGSPELVSGVGSLFAREDAEDLARVLRPLIASAELRARMGRAARERAESLPWSKTWAHLAQACDLGAAGSGR